MNLFRINPKGNDASAFGPWATLAGARNALRNLRAASKLSGQVSVLVAPGTYRLTEPVTFGPLDSHTTYSANLKEAQI
jgi:hypothetical protein